MGIPATLGSLSGHLAVPSAAGANSPGPWPAVIVIQEWWGLDDHIRRIADRCAAEGYLAFAPDLYHGELAALGQNERALALAQKHGPGAPAELETVFDALRAHPQSTGRIGSLGFCFGGRMSLALGLRRPLDAVCTFYGGGMQQLFDQLPALRGPVLGLFGDQDVSIPAGTVEQFEALLARHRIPHEIKVYPDSGHAFFRDDDPRVYKPAAAADAWERVTRFFAQALRS